MLFHCFLPPLLKQNTSRHNRKEEDGDWSLAEAGITMLKVSALQTKPVFRDRG
jgi:hypothetical protein